MALLNSGFEGLANFNPGGAQISNPSFKTGLTEANAMNSQPQIQGQGQQSYMPGRGGGGDLGNPMQQYPSPQGAQQAGPIPGAPGASQAPTLPWQQAPFSPQFRNDVGGYNPSQYATTDSSNDLARMLGGQVIQTQSAPGSPFNVPPQNMINLGGADPLNAGLLGERYGKYSREQADAMTQAEMKYMSGGSPTMNTPDAQFNSNVAGGQNFLQGGKSQFKPGGQSASNMPANLQPNYSQQGQQQGQQNFGPFGGMNQYSPFNQQHGQQGGQQNQMQQFMSLIQMLMGGQGGGQQGGQQNPFQRKPAFGQQNFFNSNLFPRFP